MSKASPADRSKLTLPDLDLLATKTRLVERKSKKFTSAAFLQSLLSSVVTGFASLNQLAAGLAHQTAAPMARQSLHQRFDKHALAFLMAVLCDLMNQRFRPVATALAGNTIQRILIEDSSGLSMPKSNSDIFSAHGNHHGPTAGVKIDFAFDLLSGSIVSHSLHYATEQDKTIGKELVVEVLPNDLVLRDMGYFSLIEFTAIEELGAFWLTRLPLNVGAYLANDEILEKHLKRTKTSKIDLEVIVGAQGKKCRLVALRATPQVVAKRRAERRTKAKESGHKPCPKGLIRDEWHLMLTNLSQTTATVEQLATIYQARWTIEIQFRAWKQSLNLSKALNRKSNEYHMQALVIAGMIAHQLGMKLAQRLCNEVGQARLSYEKLYDLLAMHLIQAPDLASLATFAPDPRHITRDRRTRQSPVESALQSLT